MSLLYGHLVCAVLTWLALVRDGMRALTPQALWRALRTDISIFGPVRVALWALLCLVAWPLVWGAWAVEWLQDWLDAHHL